MSLSSAVREALQIANPHASQDQVKTLVARQLEALTPGTSARTTDYFNHTWAPDLVVTSGDQPERRVFLRFDVKDRSFDDDLSYLSADRPFFLDLAEANPDETRSDDSDEIDLEEALRVEGRREVLVSDVSAVDRFDRETSEWSDLKTATYRVVLGGRGVVDSPAVETISTSWRYANDAVDEADPATLREALDGVEQYLSEVASLNLETAVRSRWIAAGQPAESFPGQEDWNLQAREPWEIARLVLSLIDHGTPISADRWREIASAISASALGHELYRIGAARTGGLVNDLVRAALPMWTAQYAYVPPLESDTFERFDWAIGAYALDVNLINRRAFFTDLGKKWSRVPRANVLPEAKPRLELLSDATVLGVDLITTEENISVALRPTATASLGERLEQYIAGDAEDAAWRAARITGMELRVPGTDTTADVDFGRSVVRTEQSVPLRTYVMLVAKYVAALEPSELEELAASLESPSA